MRKPQPSHNDQGSHPSEHPSKEQGVGVKQLNARHPAGEVQVRNQTRSHQVDPRNNRKNINQAGFGLGIPGLRPQVVEARYVGPQTETIVKKVMRSEYKSLVIVLLVMLGTFTALFLLALLLGWL